MSDELRDKIAKALREFDRSHPTGHEVSYKDMADAVLAIPEIAAALRQSQMIADEPFWAARAQENLVLRRRFPDLLCECGHTFLRHDPEDGRCDSRDMFELDVCWCGRRLSAIAGQS